MFRTRSMNLFITGGIIIFLAIGFIIPNTVAKKIDDRVYIDEFDDNSGINLTNTRNCSIKDEIILKEVTSTQTEKYTFYKNPDAHFGNQSSWFFFFRFLFRQNGFLEERFAQEEKGRVQKKDNDYQNISSKNIFKYAIQRYQFKITTNAEFLSKIKINWYGRVTKDARIVIYYWNSSLFPKGRWVELKKESATGSDSVITSNPINKSDIKYAIDENKYIDFCIVTYSPKISEKCTLSTNFIEIEAYPSVGHLTNGNAQSITIDPNKNMSASNETFYWELLTWDDYQPAGTYASYQILYENKTTGKYVKVEEAVLKNNKDGIRKPPIYLNNLSKKEYNNTYKKLRINVTLHTDNPSVTPRVFSWAISWQNVTRWQDSFNTTCRIDDLKKLTIENGTIRISLFQDEWPLFGYDSGNTRATNGYGPATATRYWMAKRENGSGGYYRNPIISEGKVYIFSNDRMLNIYNLTKPSKYEGIYFPNRIGVIPLKYEVNNSPAITEDYIIIATGQQERKGTTNHIYAYRKDNLSLDWTAELNSTDNICYTASPVVVGNRIFISTWGGDNVTYLNGWTNNKLICLDLYTGKMIWARTLTAASFSTPAVTSNTVIVACNSLDNYSVVAYDFKGEEKWKNKVGRIGHASPVIYGDFVFVTCEEVNDTNATATFTTVLTKIRALDLNTGNILWNVTLNKFQQIKYTEYLPQINKKYFADSTPAVYNDILYVASANGSIYAINTGDGSIRWMRKVYSWIPIISPDYLISSPAYANNLIYIGTPTGIIYALDATTGEEKWKMDTDHRGTLIRGSPAISNGLLLITDESHALYSIGTFIPFSVASANITSVQIRKPENLSWGYFNANFSNVTSPVSSIDFTLLDKDYKVLLTSTKIKNGMLLAGKGLPDIVRLQAKFTTKNITARNPCLNSWEISFTNKTDFDPPYFKNSTTPPFIGKTVAKISITVKDNKTALNITSASYMLRYMLNNKTIMMNTSSAQTNVTNKITQVLNITANLSRIPNYKNITSLINLTFSIKDMAGNTAIKTFLLEKNPPIFDTKTTPPFNKSRTDKIRIKVQDKETGLDNTSAEYTLRYIINNKTNTTTFSAQCNGTYGTTKEQNITANLSAISDFKNITSLINISFSIKDVVGNKGVSKQFFADLNFPYLYNSTTPRFNGTVFKIIRIKAKDNETGLNVSSAEYTLRYIINNKIDTKTFSAQCNGTFGTTDVQNITANLSAISDFKNIKSLISITFSIRDLAGNKGVSKTFSNDTIPPYLHPSTTPQFNGTVFKIIRIKAKDNESGLNVSSAEYTLRYIINNKTNTTTFTAQCNGTLGTTDVQNITANLSKIPNFKNIKSLISITFSIKDMAGNRVSKLFSINDTTPPSSKIINLSMRPRYNASAKFILINASAADTEINASGVKQVKLYYRYSYTTKFTEDWIYFANSTKTSPQWKFNFTNKPNQHGGYFELCTVAIDKKGNVENFPTKGDISFLYDWMIPSLPSFSENTLWFNKQLTSTTVFEDDFRLDTIQYRPNFENSWTTIATDINTSTYNTPWSLKEEYWNQMNEGEIYNIYFKINDTLGNTLETTNNNQTIKIRKDTIEPNGAVNINDTVLSYNFTVTGLANDQDSGIKEVCLYYRFSEDKSNWSSWALYGDILISPPFQWEFSAQEGDGYYEFQINVTDIAGNTKKSDALSTSVFPNLQILPALPVTIILVMISLLVVFSLLCAMIYFKWMKTKAT